MSDPAAVSTPIEPGVELDRPLTRVGFWLRVVLIIVQLFVVYAFAQQGDLFFYQRF